MSNKVPTTIAESTLKFLSVKINTKIALKRTYDDWTYKQMFRDFKRKFMIKNQALDISSHQNLGSDLAVSKFVLEKCGGQIQNENYRWITTSKDLPKFPTRSFKLTAISASNSRLLPESCDNFVGLDNLEYLDLSKNPKLDDFACDQLSRQFRKSDRLKSIDLSHNPRISIYGLEVLFRVPSIKKITAIGTLASKFGAPDLFVLAAEEERGCDVFIHEDGKKFINQELEDLRVF